MDPDAFITIAFGLLTALFALAGGLLARHERRRGGATPVTGDAAARRARAETERARDAV
jgi:hypothetical protein